MWNKLKLVLTTVRYLKLIQIYYQMFYRLRSLASKPQALAKLKGYRHVEESLNFLDYAFMPSSSNLNFDEKRKMSFTFLNVEHTFEGGNVDWNFEEKGKLWNYNLNYFEFLFSTNINQDQSLSLIQDYCQKWNDLKGGLEPYPISLRGINWVKYLSHHRVRNKDIDQCLYRQYEILKSSLEYHLLANHLLENAFSILFGAFYFRSEVYYQLANKLLTKQLTEQVLEDGAHFERSPMYHQIVLFRLLDAINLLKHNPWKHDGLEEFLVGKAKKMLAWMENICSCNGHIPMVKDSAPGIAPEASALIAYAKALNLESASSLPLGVSGYRKLTKGNMELLADIGEIEPSYQPGHAHADELNFLLWIDGKPLIVDTGVSTYEKNDRRQLERSTPSHNCVYFENQDSSRVWGGFRVAQRASVNLLKDTRDEVWASHTGFSAQGFTVFRSFHALKEGFLVKNEVEAEGNWELNMNLHFHPDAKLRLDGEKVFVNNLQIIFNGFDKLLTEKYMFARSFNQLESAVRIRLNSSGSNSILITNAD